MELNKNQIIILIVIIFLVLAVLYKRREGFYAKWPKVPHHLTGPYYRRAYRHWRRRWRRYGIPYRTWYYKYFIHSPHQYIPNLSLIPMYPNIQTEPSTQPEEAPQPNVEVINLNIEKTFLLFKIGHFYLLNIGKIDTTLNGHHGGSMTVNINNQNLQVSGIRVGTLMMNIILLFLKLLTTILIHIDFQIVSDT